MALLERTEHATYCPIREDCSYFSVPLGGDRSKNAVWSTRRRTRRVMLIKDHLAFYPDRGRTRSKNDMVIATPPPNNPGRPLREGIRI